MENQNTNVSKRYNKFRQARRKRDKNNTINVDEVSGRHYKLERFLKDCILHLPKHERECEKDSANANANSSTPKPSRPKHVKLPVLNECKGLFENVIIGRSAKKADEFGRVAATPEDRARLHEDIHALAKVGPDSELSFELFPSSPLQNRPLEDVGDGEEVPERPLSPPQRVTEISSQLPPGGSWPEERNRSRSSRSVEVQEPEAENERREKCIPEQQSNSGVNDSGFKDSTGSRKDDPLGRPFLSQSGSSFHCDCCRQTKQSSNFFDADAILEEPESVDPILAHRTDPIWLFEDAFGAGPTNHRESTSRGRDEPPFDFRRIEIQSSAPERFGRRGLGDEFPDVYTRSCREPQAVQGMLKRRMPWLGFAQDVKRYNLHQDHHVPLHEDIICLPHMSSYNRFRYNRSLSPRKY